MSRGYLISESHKNLQEYIFSIIYGYLFASQLLDCKSRRTGYELEKITETSSKLLRNQARAIEQAVIKNNPQFENVINSISEKREIYDDAVEWGESWLKKHGYDSLIK